MKSQRDQAIVDMVKKMRLMDMSSITIVKTGVDALAAKELLDRQTENKNKDQPNQKAG